MSKPKAYTVWFWVMFTLPLVSFAQKANKTPVVNSMAPTSATAGGAAFALTVSGSNFTSGSTVRWNGTNRTTTYVSNTQLRADIPVTDIATAATAQVTVYTGGRFGGTSSYLNFAIKALTTALTTITTTTTTTPTTTTTSTTTTTTSPALTITTKSLPGTLVGSSYSMTLSSTGGTLPYIWSAITSPGETGVPPGLSLLGSGSMSGRATTAGTYTFTGQVTDANRQTTTQSYTLNVTTAVTSSGTYGNVGDPYEGQGAPLNQKPISACNTSISSGGNHILTQNIGSDATQNCLLFYYPSATVNLDLGGFTVTGSITIATNQTPNIVMNGTISCNISGGVCLTMHTPGRLHHLTVQNLSQTPLANIDLSGSLTAPATSPVIRVDHVTSTVGYAPNVKRTRNIMDDGGNGTTTWGLSLEADHNYITCSDNASACQGIELWGAPNSYIHDNYFVLPSDCSLCTDSARATIFDGSSPGEFAFNTVIVRGNRAVRVREFPATAAINIHDNNFLDIRTPGRLGAVHVGENDNMLSTVTVNVYNNKFELSPLGNGVLSAAAANVNVFNNTVTCLNGDCSGAGYLALSDTFSYAATGGGMAVKNNDVSALAAVDRPVVKVCGTAVAGYACTLGTASTSGTVCNTGKVVGGGSITTLTTTCQ